MKVFLTCINAKAQHHFIEKGRFIQYHASRTVIIASLKVQLINPGLISVSLQQGRIATSVAVGDSADNVQKLLAFDPIQFNADGIAWATVGSVQHVCGQFPQNFTPHIRRW